MYALYLYLMRRDLGLKGLKRRRVQERNEANRRSFITASLLSPNSHYLSQVNFKTWGIIQQQVY